MSTDGRTCSFVRSSQMTSTNSGRSAHPKLDPQVLEQLIVHPGDGASLSKRSTSGTKADWLGPTGLSSPHTVADHDLEAFKEELADAQELLYASDRWAVLVII